MPTIRILNPIIINITPPTISALPCSLSPNLIPISMPAMHNIKVIIPIIIVCIMHLYRWDNYFFKKGEVVKKF